MLSECCSVVVVVVGNNKTLHLVATKIVNYTPCKIDNKTATKRGSKLCKIEIENEKKKDIINIINECAYVCVHVNWTTLARRQIV